MTITLTTTLHIITKGKVLHSASQHSLLWYFIRFFIKYFIDCWQSSANHAKPTFYSTQQIFLTRYSLIRVILGLYLTHTLIANIIVTLPPICIDIVYWKLALSYWTGYDIWNPSLVLCQIPRQSINTHF